MDNESKVRPGDEADDIPPCRGDGREVFDRRTLGWLFACIALLNCFLMGYFLFAVAGPLAAPSPLFEQVAANYGKRLDDPNRAPDRMTIDLLVILEYANADVRTVGVQVGFGILSGFFFATVGILLFATAVTGHFRLTGRTAASGLSVQTAVPGAVSLLLGAIIIMVGLLKDPARQMEAHSRRPVGVSLGSDDQENRIIKSRTESDAKDFDPNAIPEKPDNDTSNGAGPQI